MLWGQALPFAIQFVQNLSMARPLRIEFEGALYHITSRGNERKDIFQGRYKAIVIDKESHFLEVCRYVVRREIRGTG